MKFWGVAASLKLDVNIFKLYVVHFNMNFSHQKKSGNLKGGRGACVTYCKYMIHAQNFTTFY